MQVISDPNYTLPLPLSCIELIIADQRNYVIDCGAHSSNPASPLNKVKKIARNGVKGQAKWGVCLEMWWVVKLGVFWRLFMMQEKNFDVFIFPLLSNMCYKIIV